MIEGIHGIDHHFCSLRVQHGAQDIQQLGLAVAQQDHSLRGEGGGGGGAEEAQQDHSLRGEGGGGRGGRGGSAGPRGGEGGGDLEGGGARGKDSASPVSVRGCCAAAGLTCECEGRLMRALISPCTSPFSRRPSPTSPPWVRRRVLLSWVVSCRGVWVCWLGAWGGARGGVGVLKGSMLAGSLGGGVCWLGA